jgi:hypothetical protein
MAHPQRTKVFWFFFSKKNKKKQTLLFEKRSKNFYLPAPRFDNRHLPVVHRREDGE